MEEKKNEGTAVPPIQGSAWWRTSAGLAQLTGLLTLLGGALTAVHAGTTDWLQSQREERESIRTFEQQESTFQRQLEQSYFERAIAADSSPDAQARVLRYVRDSSNVREEMQNWARDELRLLKELSDARQRQSAAEAEKAAEEAKKLQAQVAELEPSVPAETRRKLQAEQAASQARAASLAGVAAERRREAARVAEQIGEPTTRRCKAESVQAVQLGAHDPPQDVVDGYCSSSAAIKRFDTEGSDVEWTTRYGGRNYRCYCKL